MIFFHCAMRKTTYNHAMNYERDRMSLFAINLGLGVNIILAVVKTTFGILSHSPALLAEGINSTSDVVYYVAAGIFMRMANKPADHDHPYGHRQMESIATLVIGSFVVTTALAVFGDSVDKVWDFMDGVANAPISHPFALWVALGTVAVKIFLTQYVRRLWQQTGNPIVNALAQDHRNDLFSASAASLGIFLGQRGLPWVDPLAGAFVAILILRTGILILRESSTDLMAAVPSRELAEKIDMLLKDVPGVIQLEEIHAHRFGPHIVLNLTIGIRGSLTVKQGDAIASEVERKILRGMMNVRRVHVHYHPAERANRRNSIEEIVSGVKMPKAAEQPEFYD